MKVEGFRRKTGLICAALLFLQLWQTVSTGAEFSLVKSEPNPNGFGQLISLRMEGAIEKGDADRLSRLIKDLESRGMSTYRSVTLSLNSPGGALDPSIALANTVREIGVGTHVGRGDQCMSGCAIVFMAGSWREGDGAYDPNKLLNPEGVLGFHAPFAFADKSLPEEIKNLLLPDAERGGAIAASKLLKLSLNDMMPASLVEELLQYKAGTFLYIDNVDRAGRWQIPLEGEVPLKSTPATVMTVHDALSRHCENNSHWVKDTSFENRDGTYGLPENSLWWDGMNSGCKYTPLENGVAYEIRGEKGERRGTVMAWQTKPGNTPLTDLAGDKVGAQKPAGNPFANPPVSQVDGRCKNGYQWIGGWSGAYWQDSIAHATYRRCDGSQTLLAFECRHGTGQISRRLNLAAFGAGDVTSPKITTQVDNNLELGDPGKIETDRGTPQHVFSLQKGYFTFEQLKSGTEMVIRINGQPTHLHLTGSRKAFEAMERSCL